MCAALVKAIDCAVKREFGSMLGCPNLSKLKSGLKTKSAVAACILPSYAPERVYELRGHTVRVGNEGPGAQPRALSRHVPRGGTYTHTQQCVAATRPGAQ